MSVAIMPTMRAGMGELLPPGIVLSDPSVARPRVVGGVYDDGSRGATQTGIIVGGAINKGLDILGDIFGNPYSRQAAYRSQTPQQPIYNVPGQSQYLPQRTSTGVGFGVDGQGIRLSDGSHIGWFPIAGLVLAFVLLQSRPLSRR